MELTDQQAKIIKHPKCNILVSSSAGTGKTFVMTERIVHRLSKRQIDMRNLLVLTFTNNAAANMKSKIEGALRTKIKKTDDPKLRDHLVAQLQYLPQAYISSFHSFCNRTIQTFDDLLFESTWFDRTDIRNEMSESVDGGSYQTTSSRAEGSKRALLKGDPGVISDYQWQQMLDQ
ncbi:MAG TPA: UvrD-helicase domain-containing protein, partial [Clostridiaceae bacterium]|nr:UvrD-helicase domain-containing protein [Clostridiaceae bacterium]